MKIKEIGISVSRTFNLGNFESFRVEASVAASLDEGETPESVRGGLLDEVRASLRETYLALKPKGAPG